MGFVLGWGGLGPILGERRSRLYPHILLKFGFEKIAFQVKLVDDLYSNT